jgi:tetratricopeptide (TPR) repeat protein
MSRPAQDPRLIDRRASEWMHQGIDLMNQNAPAALEQAVKCFDQAIALRRTLPLAENPRHRYGLAAGWMNRADALSRLGTKEQLAEAAKSYDEALALLRSLPLEEDALYPRRLAIAWINRGLVRQREMSRADVEDAIVCFREAITVFEKPASSSIADLSLLRAGALTNLVDALLDVADSSAEEGQTLAQQAVSLVGDLERTDRVAAATGFKARHVLCRAIAAQSRDGKSIPPEFLAAAANAVDEGLALARHWEERGEGGFRAVTGDLFRFGCRVHRSGEPRILANFILEALDPERAGAVLPLDGEIYATAIAALWSSLEEIQRDFQSPAAPGFERVMENLRHLRAAETRLEDVRRAAPRLQTSSC